MSDLERYCHFCGGTPTPFLVNAAPRCKGTACPSVNLVDCCEPCLEERLKASPPAPADPTSPEPHRVDPPDRA